MNIEYIKKLIKQITAIGERFGFDDYSKWEYCGHSVWGSKELELADPDAEIGAVEEIIEPSTEQDTRPKYSRIYEGAWKSVIANLSAHCNISICDIKNDDMLEFEAPNGYYSLGVIKVYVAIELFMSAYLINVLKKFKIDKINIPNIILQNNEILKNKKHIIIQSTVR